MDEKICVVPKPGLTVINPATKAALPAGGAEVERNVYWTRRLNDGDVTLSAGAIGSTSGSTSAKRKE